MALRIRDEKIALLRELPMFAGASTRELRDVAAAADICDVTEGRFLCRAGRRALECYVVVRGMVDVQIDGSTVATLRRGQIVGEVGIIDGEPRSADVVAATEVTVLAIPAPAVRALIDTSHTVRRALLGQLASRIRSLDLDLSIASAV